MRDKIADLMWTVAFKIWDLPGLADDRWIRVHTDDEYDVYPDTWIGRLADRLARWIYFKASDVCSHQYMPDEYAEGQLCFYDYGNDGFYYFDEINHG